MDNESIAAQLAAIREEIAALRRQIFEDKMAQPVLEVEQAQRMGRLWTQRRDQF